MKQLLYLIGQPGAGKTTIVRKALEGCLCESVQKPFAMRLYPMAAQPVGAQLGADRTNFAGTDTLGLNVQPFAEQWLVETGCQLILGEGDRLGNHKFFKCARQSGVELTVAVLLTPDDIAADRRRQRGSSQNEKWIAGRRTKINGLMGWWSPKWVLDGCASVDELAMRLREHPVIEGIRRSCGV